MKKLLSIAFLAAIVLSLGCAITNYPVIFDTRGADQNAVMQSFYDKAYIIPSAQAATIYDDGTDELFTLVTQDWKGDQWLYTYNNFDPTAAVEFLDQTYCDPTHQTDCWIVRSWNPDLPEIYAHGDQGAGYNNVDNIFDYEVDSSCSGYRSFSVRASLGSRIGECGSGVWQDKQAAAYEFSLLERATFRGKQYYHLPIDSSIATFAFTSGDGASAVMPIYGRFNGYVDEHLRMALPVTPNAKYQLRWIDSWVKAHGQYTDVNLTYGSLNANFQVSFSSLQGALNRL